MTSGWTWYVIAIAGLLGFVAMTLFIAGHGVFPFDGPLLERATSYSAFNSTGSRASSSAIASRRSFSCCAGSSAVPSHRQWDGRV